MRGHGNIRGRSVRRRGNGRRNRQPHEILDGPWKKEENNALPCLQTSRNSIINFCILTFS